MATFTRKGLSKTASKGTKPSIKTNQLLVSTGVPSFDEVLGGGVALGTCLLIEEDVYGLYASDFLKHFIAEGIVDKQRIFLSSLDVNPADILKELPSVVDDFTGSSRFANRNNDELKIAWRYKDIVLDSDKTSSSFGKTFTMSTKMVESEFVKAKITYFNEPSVYNQYTRSNSYTNLLEAIKLEVLKSSNVTRIALHSIGSPMWFRDCTPESDQIKALCQFLLQLRSKIRNSQSVCVVTVPAYLLEEHAWEIEQFCDSVIRIESFASARQHPNLLYKDYDGLFHLLKLPCLNTLIPNQLETLQYGFKTKKKQLTVEKLYLPPDLSETASREIGKSSSSCSASTSRNLDF